MKKWDVVVVEWEDAFSDSADPKKSVEFIASLKPCIRYSSGFLIHKDKERIVLASVKDTEANVEGDCEDITVIPMGMVREIVEYS